jgi:hypothetical protein
MQRVIVVVVAVALTPSLAYGQQPSTFKDERLQV